MNRTSLLAPSFSLLRISARRILSLSITWAQFPFLQKRGTMSDPSDNHLKKLISEIHRRSLWQVLGIYVVASWFVLQVVDVLANNFGLSPAPCRGMC